MTEQRLAAEAAASRAMPVRPPCDGDDGTHAAAARLAMLPGTLPGHSGDISPAQPVDAAAGRDVALGVKSDRDQHSSESFDQLFGVKKLRKIQTNPEPKDTRYYYIVIKLRRTSALY